MDKIWKEVTGPSAGLVQRHYISARKEELARRHPDLEKTIQEFLEGNPSTSRVPWLTAYHKITDSLQKAHLTLNFEEENWFADDKIEALLTYESYTQMYERSTGADGKTRLADSNVNTGAERARVDDAVTFPANWAGDNANQPQRGLKPGRPSGQRLLNQMQFGAQNAMVHKDLWSDSYGQQFGVKSLNPHFNAKAKQVFAALNYGRRPHGSSTFYGQSYLQLSPKLKVNALYYPGDTFVLPEDTSTQVSYNILGAILAYRQNPFMQKAVVSSCYNDTQQDDTRDASLLLEAHIFSPVVFRQHLVAVFLPAERNRSAIYKNAKKFADKYGVKVVLQA